MLSLSSLVTVVLALAAFTVTETEGYTVNSINTQLELSEELSHGLPSSSDMYVYTGGKLGRIDGDPASDQYNTIYSKAILPSASPPSDILFNPRSNHVYITSGDCFKDRTYISLANIHSGTIVQNIEFTKGFGGQILMPTKLVYNNNNGDMYVRATKAFARDGGCVTLDNSILVIDSNTNSVYREIKLNCSDQINCFRLMTFVHKEGVSYIYGLTKSGIQVLDTRSGNIVKTIEVGDPTQDAADIRYNPYDGKIYVIKQGPYQLVPKPNPDDNCLDECVDVPCREGVVSVVDPISDTVLDDNAEIHCPSHLGFSENQEIFVTQFDRGAGSGAFYNCTDPGFVSILNPGLDIISQVHVGRCPNHVGRNSANGNMYVSNEGSFCGVSFDPNCSRLCENTPGAANILRDAGGRIIQCQLPYTISVISTLKPSVSNVTTSIIDRATNEDITNKRGIPFGTRVYDIASVHMGWKPPVPYPPVESPIPIGKIRYTFFLNAKCTNETGLWPDGAWEEQIIENNGYVRRSSSPTLKYSPAASFQATYIDDKNSTVTGNCEPIPEVLPPSINSKILKNYTYPPKEVTSVPEGTVVFDSATFSNTNRVPPEGTVTYQRFDNSYCEGEPVHRDVVNVTYIFGPYIPYSSNFTAHGNVSYLAIYHGMNILDHWTDSGCEKLAISSVGLEIIDQNNTIVTNGTVGPNGTVRAFAIISEDLRLAGGTVNYQLFRGNDCDETTHDASWDKKVEVGTDPVLPPSDAFSFTSPETISYKATYDGPAGSIDSHCKFVTSISQ
jgi:hypothetical protein